MTKTISIKRRLALLLALAFTCVAQGWAYSKTYYAKLTVKATPTGSGTVYASTNNSDTGATYAETSESDPQSTQTQNESKTFYAFAKANDGYAFAGWFDNENCTGNGTSSDNPCTVTIAASSSSSDDPSTTTLYAKFEAKKENTFTFVTPENGNITVNGETNPSTVTSSDELQLVATAKDGYKFLGWYTTTDGGTTKTYFSRKAETSKYFSSTTTIGCDFVTKDTPIFIIKGDDITPYTNLNAADKAATTKTDEAIIILVDDGTLATGDYTISANNTLLIPFDDANTVYKAKGPDAVTPYTDPSVFRTLTMDENASLVIKENASLCVGAKMFSEESGKNRGGGAVTGPYGLVKMKKNSKITVENGGSLYAWGYISSDIQKEDGTLEGQIDALSGAKVYENFIIRDFRGGTATSAMKSEYKVFPFNQYYIQNIEVPLTINSGAAEQTFTALHAQGSDYPINFTLIGSDAGLFKLSSGSRITKSYNATNDQQVYEIEGDASLSSITFSLVITVNSESYVLPVTNNMKIIQKKGNLKIEQDCALLPGTHTVIEDGAGITIAKGKNLYIYDKDQWEKYSYTEYLMPIYYTHVNQKKIIRTYEKMTDAIVDVEGTITATGNIYTTESGAQVVGASDGTGKVVIKNSTTEDSKESTYQYLQSGPTLQTITVYPLWLQNSDKSYTKTAGMTLDEESNSQHTVYYRGGYWEPRFTFTDVSANNGNGSLVLDNNYPVKATDVTKAVSEKCAGSKPLSIDLSNADIEGGLTTGNIATLRAAMGATATTDADGNTVAATNPNGLLLVPSTISGIESDETENVVVVTGTGDNRTATAKSLVITDKQPLYVPTDLTVGTVTYTRTNTTNDGEKQWGTICLPYKLTSGDNIQYYKLGSVDLDKNTMTFERVETVAPNVPAIYATTQTGGTLEIGGSTVEVKTTTAESKGEAVTFGDGQAITLVGVQKATKQLTTADNGTCYYISKNKFWTTTKNAVNVKPQRAYFEVTGGTGAKVFTIGEADGAPTFIEGIGTDGAVEVKAVGVYSTSGARQNGLQPGLNIVRFSDGSTRKIIVK